MDERKRQIIFDAVSNMVWDDGEGEDEDGEEDEWIRLSAFSA
jgi:hypothetical protein